MEIARLSIKIVHSHASISAVSASVCGPCGGCDDASDSIVVDEAVVPQRRQVVNHFVHQKCQPTAAAVAEKEFLAHLLVRPEVVLEKEDLVELQYQWEPLGCLDGHRVQTQRSE